MLALFNWEITSDLFFGTVSSVFSPNMFKKQDGMLAFFLYCAHGVLAQNCKKQKKRNARLFRPKKSCSTYFFCTVSLVFFPNVFEKQNGMLASFM